MKKVTKEMLFRYAFPAAMVLLCGALAFGGAVLAGKAELRRGTGEPLPADEPLVGIGRNPAVVRYLAPACAGEAETARTLETYTDGESPVPAWYQPGEDMAVEWRQTERHDVGCPDWNVDSTLWGWDGHGMEVWEMDLFARIVYLEFWGTSTACVEAGIDSMLLLWDMGEYGRTMGELLSAQYAPGYYVYSPYAYVWDWDYDPDGLAEIRAVCEERFVNGPTWCAPYFRLWYYHDWAVPAYEIDGVYFSVAGVQ